MDKRIAGLRDHVIVCGWGRVGRAIAKELAEAGQALVVVDNDPERVATIDHHLYVLGDATSDDVLRHAGIERSTALVAALSTDAENLFITLSGRALRPDLLIVARAREESSTEKLTRAGADRVVNPQEIGGARMAAFLLHPHVTDFLDVIMRDRTFELRLEEVPVLTGSPFVGQSLRQAHVRDRTGALILAVRRADGSLLSNPEPDIELGVGEILIAIGTGEQLRALAAAAAPGRRADAPSEPSAVDSPAG